MHFRQPVFPFVFLLCIASGSSLVHGGLMLGLDSGTTDLTTLAVGDSFTIDVSLSGLGDPGEPSQLSDLVGTVVIPSEFSVDPASLAGGIAPLGIIPGDFFFLDIIGGNVDGQFLALFDNISANGLFYSFELTAIAAGTGSIGFDPFSPTALDENFFPVTVGENSLPYSVSAGNSNVVPEPSTLVCFAAMK